MAKQIKSSDLFEGDVFTNVRDSAQQTIVVIEKFNNELNKTAKTIKSSLGNAKFDSTKSINEFIKLTEKAQKLQMDAIKLDNLHTQSQKQLHDAETARLKSQTEKQRTEQQAQKTTQESLKTDQQKIKTEREKLRLDKELEREAERKAKAEQKEIANAQKMASAYNQLVVKTRELKNGSKELAGQMIILEQHGQKNTKEYRDLAKTYKQVTSEAIKADATLKKIDSTVGDNFRNVGNYNGAINKLRNGLGQLGLAFGLGTVITAGISKIVEFDQAIADLSAITGATGDDLEYFKTRANEMGSQVVGGASAIVEAYKLIGSAKPELLKNAKALDAVTQSAITLSQASGMTLPESATALTDAMNQFGADASQATRFIDTLANGAKFGAVEIPQVTEALLKFGAVAKSSNVDIEESTALIEMLGEKGLKGAEAGTALRNVMLKLSAPDALPKPAQEALQGLGISFDELKDKSKPFSERLKALKPLLNDNASLIKVFGVENAVAGLNLIQNTDRIKELNGQMHENGTATEQAKARTATLGFALNQLKESFFGLFTSMTQGDGATKIFVDGIKWLAVNLGTIVKLLAKVALAWGLYRATLKSVQLVQFIASGGLKELAKTMIENVKNVKLFTKSTKEAGTALTETGEKAEESGKSLNGIPWVMLIGLAVELAMAIYDIASGLAEQRRQSDMLAKANAKAERNVSAITENTKKWVDEQKRLLDKEIRQRKINGESAVALEDEKLKRITEIEEKGLQRIKDRGKLRTQELAFLLNLKSEYDRLTASGSGATTAQLKEIKDSIANFAGTNDLRVALDILSMKTNQFTEEIVKLNASEKEFVDLIDESKLQDLEADLANYTVNVADNTLKVNANTNAQKELATQLDAVNDYLVETIELNKQLNDIYNQRKLAQFDDGINTQIQKDLENISETGEFNTSKVDAMIAEKYDFEKQMALEQMEWELNQLDIQNDAMQQKELDAITANRDKLLEQVGLTDAQKIEIEKSYQQRLGELKIENEQRDVDTEKKRIVLAEKTTDKIIELDKKQLDETVATNQKYIDEWETRNQKEIDAEIALNEKLAEKRKKRAEQQNEFVKITADYFIKRSNDKIAQLEKEIAMAEKQSDILQQLAINGNINAKESLAEQQRIINEANLKKEKELKRQQRIKLAESVYSTYNSKVADGSKNPLADTIKDTILLQQFINSIPTFFDGTENTGTNGNGIDGKGGFHAVLHPNERVVPKSLNDKIGGMSNESLAKLAMEYNNGKIIRGNEQVASGYETALLISKFDELNNTIKNKPETNIELGEIMHGAMEIIKSTKKGNTSTFNRYKIKP